MTKARNLACACAAAGLGALLAATGPAAADSFSVGFGYHSHGGYHGPGYGHYGRYGHYRHRGHWHPHYGYGSRIVIVPPPRVVYEPAPAPVPGTTVAPPSGPQVSAVPADKRYCREYQSTVTIAGEEQQTWGTACLQPDGRWRIID